MTATLTFPFSCTLKEQIETVFPELDALSFVCVSTTMLGTFSHFQDPEI